MYYKKIAGLFLFLSAQTHGMLTVNEFPIKSIVSTKAKSKKNYKYNEPFFKNKMTSDSQFVLINSLDHRSNIQLIRTSKHLYDRYIQKGEGGEIKYHTCLFTKHPFQFSSPVDFNVYFDCYTGALFHYATTHEDGTKILLSIESEVIQGANTEMLKMFKIEDSEAEAVMDFYKQKFTYEQFDMLAKDPVLFQAMLKRGISLGVENKQFLIHTALRWNNNIEIIKILLADSRVNPNMQDKNGDTILHKAVWLNKIEMVKVLLTDSRVDLNLEGKDGFTALHKAVWWNNNIEIIKILLADHRINPNMQDRSGDTVLHKAVSLGKIGVIEILLADHRINPNMQDENGDTVLHKAASLGNIGVIEILLADNRVDLSRQNNNGYTAFQKATTFSIKMMMLGNCRAS